MQSNVAERETAKGAAGLKKVTVNFAKETYGLLAGLASKQQVTMSEALRRAIKIHAFLDQKVTDGDAVVIRKKDGPDVELMLGL